jgi:multidrug transporter EmrE-like cation transporter
MYGTLVGFILSLNDIISYGLTKKYYLKEIGITYGLYLPMILYSLQIPLFYYGLQTTTMAILNITWNLFSNIFVTLVGVFYFKEKFNGLNVLAILMGISSIVLFTLDSVMNKN